MKIKSWMEVDGVENVSYRFQCAGICVGVRKKETNFLIAEINTSAVSKTVVIDFLKLFGFSVEFIEPPKLSGREWHFVNYLSEDWWIARNADMGIYVYKAEPKKGSNGFWTPVFWQEMLLNRCLFPFITPDRAWSVKELRELEVENDD